MKNTFALNKGFWTLILFLILIAFSTRFINLRADPSILLDSGQVGDEGYWIYNARNLNTFGHLANDDFYHDFAAAPFFSFVSFLYFWAFGVGFWQARAVSALAGLLTIIAAYRIALLFGKNVALISTFLLSVNTLLILHNRLAVPESLSILFMTLSVLFMIKNKYFLSGCAVSFALLSKTTAFLFLPSAAVILIADYIFKKVDGEGVRKFLAGALLTITATGLPTYLLWGKKFVLIYSTFGKWYSPSTLSAFWGNVINFFTNPFWGSPFAFSLVILALINIIATCFKKFTVSRHQSVLQLWLFGSLILTPFMSQVTNARLLHLLIPLSILAGQTIASPSKYFLRIKEIRFSRVDGIIKTILIFFLSYPPAVLLGKFFLAFVKRMSGNAEIVNLLPIVSIILFMILGFISNLLKKSGGWIFLVRANVILLVCLPVISFVPTFVSLLDFFDIMHITYTSVTILKILALVILASGLFFNKIVYKASFVLLCILYLLFSAIGLASILWNPSYNYYNSSKKLGQYADEKAMVGFLGHEMAIENRSWPIYFAPRLNYVSVVNQNYSIYNPKILLVPKIFDNRLANKNDWLSEDDFQNELITLIDLDLSREFLTGKREVKINVYEIRENLIRKTD